MACYSDRTWSNNLWYLIHCQPRKEAFAAQTLRTRLGIPVYFPEYTLQKRGSVRQMPFFPGYIFAQADLQQVPRSEINSSPGVIRLVDFGGEPQPVPCYVIDSIVERLTSFDGLNRQELRFGDRVRVNQESPLQNLEMIFLGPTTPGRRVYVLLNLLGRLKEMPVDALSLEKVPASKGQESSFPQAYLWRERFACGQEVP